MQQFIQKIASIKVHLDKTPLRSEQPTDPGLFARTLPNSEIRKTMFVTFQPNGMHDETHIRLTQALEMDRQKTTNRSGGNMLSHIQEHLHSRIPELSETQTLPL
jgi:hypothetical protein